MAKITDFVADLAAPIVERAGCSRLQHRFHFPGFRSGQKLQPRDTILDALLQLFAQPGKGGFFIGNQQGAAAGKGYFQFRAQLPKGGVGTDGHFRFSGMGLIVIAGIDDGGIGPGDARANILRRFHKNRGDIPFSEIPGGKTP